MPNNPEFILNQKGILYKLKEHSFIQSVLINNLLTQKKCHIENIAMMLQTNVRKLEQVLLEEESLSVKESVDLVHLFYIANSH